MPNRVLRDWTDSDRINTVDFQSEVLFTRLMMKADDYGAFHANPKLINAFCFPLKNIRDTDISRWLQELVSAGLIALYTADNKPYLHIINFGQRLRQMRNKFPQISENELNEFLNKNGQRVVSELSASCQPETETETETRGEMPQAAARTKLELLEIRKSNFYDDLKPFLSSYNKEMLRKFYEYWSEFNKSKTKMRWELQDTFEISKRLSTWASRDKEFDENSNVNFKKPPKSVDL